MFPKCNLASPSRLVINSSKAINSFLTSRDISSSISSLSKGVERDDEDASVPLAIRQVTFLVGEFSFGESKSENVGVEVVAKAATPLEVSSSSSSLSEEYSSWVINKILPDFLLMGFFLMKGFL